jgi:hypothetical protein
MKCTVVVPYIWGISEKIYRLGKEFGICTAFRPQTTLQSILTKTRPKMEIQEIKNLHPMQMWEEIWERQKDHFTPESPNRNVTQEWEKCPSPKQQNTRGMRTIEYNGIRQKSHTKKKELKELVFIRTTEQAMAPYTTK